MTRQSPHYWLMKSEPFKYGWDDLVAEGEGTWDGVRNYQARNNLAAMAVGDEAFFYHSRRGVGDRRHLHHQCRRHHRSDRRDGQMGSGEGQAQAKARPSCHPLQAIKAGTASGPEMQLIRQSPLCRLRGDGAGMAGDLRNGERVIAVATPLIVP